MNYHSNFIHPYVLIAVYFETEKTKWYIIFS